MKSKYFFILSIILFVISLVLPVQLSLEKFSDYYVNDSHSELLGIAYFILGYITILETPIDFFCWLGNFTLIASWLLFFRMSISRILSIASILLMSFYGIDNLFKLEIMEFHNYNYPLFGYWFWLASSLMMLFYTTRERTMKI